MKKLRVLIAGDDDAMRNNMVVLLATDYEIVGAVTNGRELLRTAAFLLPDVIVADITTLLIDSAAVRDHLVAQGHVIPFVCVYGENREMIQVRTTGGCFAFVCTSEISMHLVDTVRSVSTARTYTYCLNPFDPTLEEQNVVLIEERTLRRAERMISSCEACNTLAEIPFDQVLDCVTGSDSSVTEYIMKKLGSCPNCLRSITEKTLVMPTNLR